MNNLPMTRLLPSEAEKNEECIQDFLEDSRDGKLVAVYVIHPSEKVNLFISEYENGKFWTIGGREDYLGTLTGAIDFLINEFM